MGTRKFMCVERIEYRCTSCHRAGHIVEIFINPDLLLLRGYCEACRTFAISRVVDIKSLQNEFELEIVDGVPTVN